MKASIEFSTKQIIILIIMVIIAVIVISLSIKFSDKIKSLFSALLASSESVA